MTDSQRCQVLDIMRAELERMRKLGSFDGNPHEMHPVVWLTRLLVDPGSSRELVFGCAKELLPYCEAPKSAQLKLDASGLAGRDFNITIVVPSWAAQQKADEISEPRAIETSASHVS